MSLRTSAIRIVGLVGLGPFVLLTACSSDEDGGSDATALITASTPTTADPDIDVDTTATSTSPATTTAPLSSVPSSSVPTGSAIAVTEIELLGSPDWLVVDQHGLWVRGEPGLVMLIDPESNERVGEVSVGGEPCQGLGAGAGSIFTCAGRDVVRIDPDSLEVMATYPVGKAYSQGELAVSGSTLWVLLGDGSTLVPIDVETDTPGTPITLPVRGTDLAFGGAGLWVASAVDDTVLRIDEVTGDVLHTVEVSNSPYSLAVDEDVWAMGPSETVRIDPDAGAVDLSVPVGGEGDGSIAVSPGFVWVHSRAVPFTQIDRTKGDVITDATLEATGAEIAERTTSAGDMVFGFGSIWATASDDARLFRVDLG